jgi:DNA replication protein DnaD
MGSYETEDGEVMARPQKDGLDYFPLNVDIDGDDKLELIEAKYGIVGFGVIIKLFMKIYKEGYFYAWGEKEQLLHSKRVNVDINTVIAIINDSVKWGLFDKDLFEEYGILTSHGIQKRYLEAAKRRTIINMISEFWLNVDIKDINVNINFINYSDNTQRKEKKRIIQEDERAREGKVFEYYGQNYGLMAPAQVDLISSYLDDGLTPELIIKILEDGLGKDDKWSWVRAVLLNCLSQNVKTVSDYEAKKVERKSRDRPPGKGQEKEDRIRKATQEAFEELKKEGIIDAAGRSSEDNRPP